MRAQTERTMAARIDPFRARLVLRACEADVAPTVLQTVSESFRQVFGRIFDELLSLLLDIIVIIVRAFLPGRWLSFVGSAPVEPFGEYLYGAACCRRLDHDGQLGAGRSLALPQKSQNRLWW